MKSDVINKIHDTYNMARNLINKTKMQHLQTGHLVT